MEKSLEQFGEQQLAIISPLEARSLALKGAAELMVVTDIVGLNTAIALKRDLNAHAKAVKDLRLEITRPLDKVKDLFTAKEKEILAPVDEGKAILEKKVLDYEAEQERLRQIEDKRIADIVHQVESIYKTGMTENQIETGRAAAKKMIAELPETDKTIPKVNLAFLTLSNRLTERANDLEVEKQRAKKQKLEDEATKIENEKREIAARAERQRIEAAEIEAAKAAAREEAARPKAGIREETRFEIEEESLVPREWCSPDEKKIRAWIKENGQLIEAGIGLAGVRIWKEKVVR